MKRIQSFILLLFCAFLFENAKAQSPNFSYTQTCYGNQTTLVASSSLPDTAISMWQWDLDGNGTYELNGKTIITLVTINDTIAVKLKIKPKSAAADSITKNVIIDPLPQVNFITNNTCQSSSATFSSQSVIAFGSITQFLWDFNNDGITDDNTNDTVSFNCGPAQTFTSKLTCVSNKGCSHFSQKTTTVFPNPVASFTAPPACSLNPTLFTNTTIVTSPDFFLWNFGDGNQSLSSGNTTHLYATSGNWNVEMIAVSQAGCRDTFNAVAVVNVVPSVSVGYDTSIFQGNSLTIYAAGTSDVISYAWSTGDATDNITISESGSYWVMVTNSAGCTWNDTISILVNEVPDTIAVSGFILTPNDDNINDALIVNNISAYANCDLKVYSMWNDEVFVASGYKNNWKGTNASGGNLQSGAYYYIIMCDDKPMLKGNINILR
ncbi:MAG: T9SS type B sorting domain-containing protein [Bacteroidetes bacterium]|nr:MAG: T9SS type B sorting domain-containing protein [Bacteroidota bacterium]